MLAKSQYLKRSKLLVTSIEFLISSNYHSDLAMVEGEAKSNKPFKQRKSFGKEIFIFIS